MGFEDNIYDLLLGDSGDSRSAISAMANQLRNKRQMQNLAALGAEGNPIENIGRSMGGQAAQDANNMFKGLEARMHYGPESYGLKASLQAQKDTARYQTAAMMANAAAQRSHETNLARLQMKAMGLTVPDAKAEADANKQLPNFIKSINPLLQSSRSGLGSSGIINLRGSRVMRLFQETDDKTLDKIPPAIVNEAVQGIASMVNGGYAPAITAIHELSPHTIGMNAAQLAGWLTNQPVGANQAKYLKMMIGIIERENKHAKAVQASNFMTQLNGYPGVVKYHPKEVRNAARTLGIEDYLDDNLEPKPGVIEALTAKRLPEELSAASSDASLPRINDEAAYNALPAGTKYFHVPSGKPRIKGK